MASFHRCVSIIFLMLYSIIAHANNSNVIRSEPIEVHKGDNIALGEMLDYFQDQSAELSFSQIRALPDSEWLPHSKEVPNFGYSSSAYWFKTSFANPGLIETHMLLSIQYPLLDYIDIYWVKDGVLIDSVTTGDVYPFDQRPLRHRGFLFPITLFHDEPVEVYIRIASEGALQLPIHIVDEHVFYLEDQDELLYKSFYYGIMFIMVLYNLFIYLSIKERPYIYYVVLVSSVLVMMAGAHGILFQYVYPGFPEIHRLSMLITVPLTMFFACRFSSMFLRLSVWAPKFNMVLNGLAVLFFLCIVGAFFLPYSVSTTISVFMAIPASIIIMLSGPYAWYKGETSAQYFTFAWAFLLGGIIIGASSKFGFLPRNLFTEYALNWGSAVEAMLLSFALADRFNRERLALFKAQNEKLIEAEQRKAAESKMYYQATHQAVDGLPNMTLLQQTLSRLIHSQNHDDRQFSLIFIHLKRVQEVNKTLGHANADLIMNLFSERLIRAEIDKSDIHLIEEDGNREQYFCHIEGVVYAMILRTGDPDKARNFAAEIKSFIGEPIAFNGMELDLGIQMGIASCPLHGNDIGTLIRHTRVAIDGASNINDNIGVYSPEINPYTARRLALMGELRKAINENSLELYFQPIVDCTSRRACGAEALLRWNHTKMGFIPPDEFISVAEKTGMMRSLTMWVLEEALMRGSQWSIESKYRMISVNISAVNLQEPDFVSNVQCLLNKYQMEPQNLVFEVTETAVMEDPEFAIQALCQLNELGVRIALDDFGTGHSSLSYVRKLPVFEIKIDRSFVMSLDQSEEDAVIARTTLNLSHDLGYKVVAEGVENEGTLNLLQRMGCDLVQGYHIAKPMPADEFESWLALNQKQDNASIQAS